MCGVTPRATGPAPRVRACSAGRDVQRHRVPAVAGTRRARPVGRQRQFLGHPGQRRPPLRDLARQQAVRVVARPRAAPAARARSPRTAPAAAPTPAPSPPIRAAYATDTSRASSPHRPGVARDVVEHHHEHVLTGSRRSSRARSGICPARSNGAATSSATPRRGRPRPSRRRAAAPAQLASVENPLVRLAVGGGEHRPQHLMPPDHVAERRRERASVQVPGEAHRHGQVVDRARALELRQEPQPLLRERQRHPLRPFAAPSAPAGRGPPAPAVPPARRGGRLEHHPDARLHVQHRAHPADQAYRQQRVPAEREEVIVGPDPLQAEHVGEDRAQELPRTLACPWSAPAPGDPG